VASFPYLMAPGQIGPMMVRNRVVMSPMERVYGTPDGLPSGRTRDYFAARAKGGVGLITLGATGVDHQHPETPGGLHLATDQAVDAHRALVDVVHEHGAKIQPQIVHAGPDGLGPEIFGVTSLGPSVIPSYLTGRPSLESSKQQLCTVLDLFKAAARRAVEAGYDGIELHAAHGYMLFGSFLAPQRNRRTDEYRGDSAHGRVRVVLDALAAIRSEIGDPLPITLRVSGYERVVGGRPIYETAGVAPELVAAGVDAFHVSGGVIDRLVTDMVNGADDGDGLNIGAAAAVKQVVDVPVIAVGRIHDPSRAEQILADRRADFIAMGRPLLADPDLPRKLLTCQAHRVRKCISCENCIDAMEQRFSVDCAVNPRTGKERELAALGVTVPCGPPPNGSPPTRWCSHPQAGPAGSWRPTASCWPAPSNPTPPCSTPSSPPCPAPRCTPPATARASASSAKPPKTARAPRVPFERQENQP
jgi:2,4-dienoyl-CoA reductase-like NADH-dependent reductase (Old Yellow Enzyme family)